VIRFERPEDFRVEEIPLYPASGEGGHTFLRIEKTGRTTEDVARDLARAAGVAPREVGYAGRKDRVAIATQWFSVPALEGEAALRLELPGVRVLEAARHPHRLRTGQLRANRFDAFVRDAGGLEESQARARLERMVRRGLPNRFGAQRFGRDGQNARRGAEILRSGRAPRDRRAARFLLSALQAQVFNEVLAARGDEIDRLETGDVAVVHRSGGLFRVDDPAREAPRADRFEISPTGPIFGSRMPEPGGAVAERERSVLAAHGVAAGRTRPVRGVTLRGARRALRVRPEEAALECGGGGLRVRFVLPAGSYASVLLEELIRSDESG
jgi:tRNA pseudouridine13 synthase